jgi:hypothetical protein
MMELYEMLERHPAFRKLAGLRATVKRGASVWHKSADKYRAVNGIFSLLIALC